MNGLDLFSGIGGITKALQGYVRPIAYCENDRYAQSVLLSRMWTGDLPWAPIADDVSSLRGSDFISPIDIIYGGFPCQDLSVAGGRKGLAGKRSGLFFQIVRIVSEVKPKFVFLENVPNIRSTGADVVVGELARLGYSSRWGVLSAWDVGSPQERERFFLLAKSPGSGRRDDLPSESVDASKNTFDQWENPEAYVLSYRNENEYEKDPRDLRVADGVPFYVDRLRACGNAVVPAQAREAFERLIGIKKR